MTSRRPGCAGWGLPRLPIDRKTGQDILTNVPGIRVQTTNDEQDRGSGQRNNQREMQRMTHAPSRQKYRAAKQTISTPTVEPFEPQAGGFAESRGEIQGSPTARLSPFAFA
jgi:hypothetical protein